MAAKTPPGWKLWHPTNKIQFAAAGSSPLYPVLNMSRFLYGSSADSLAEAPTTTSAAETTTNVPPADGDAKATAVDKGAEVEATKVQPAKEAEAQEGPGEGQDALGDPPATTLDYKIPDDAFRAARRAAPGTPQSFWSYTLYRGPGADAAGDARVKVHYCRSKHTVERVCQYFLKEKVVGFDLEWMPDAARWQGARRNVCLAQIASESRIALFHLSLFPMNDDLVAPSFRRIMEDPEITKAGVWIKGDCTRLRTYLGINSRGIFELSNLYKLVKYSKSGEYGAINRRLVPLATQVQECLGLPMFKGQDVRSSDWSRVLRMDQIIYSASDAYAGVQLFALLEHQREQLNPKPPRPYHAELGLPIRLADGVVIPSAEDAGDVGDAGDAAARKGEENRVATTLPVDFVTSATADIKMEVEIDELQPVTRATSAPPRTASASAAKPKDSRIVAAEAWLLQYRTSNPKPRAAGAALRAYHIWTRNDDLGPVAIAALLREPPLQINTVVGYILEAIKQEKLPYPKARLRDEVLALLPREVLDLRHKTLARACAGVGGGVRS